MKHDIFLGIASEMAIYSLGILLITCSFIFFVCFVYFVVI